jgi:hypothetical protein
LAVKVTEEEIERINELYCELGVKARVAEIVGRSASTISKYIIPNYVPKAQRIEILFEKDAGDCEQLIMKIQDEIAQMCGVSEAILKNCSIDAAERAELEALRKEIF